MTMSRKKRDTITLGWRPVPGATLSREWDEYVEVPDNRADSIESTRLDLTAIAKLASAPTASFTAAIFESTGQAVHVAYTIMSQPAQQDSMLRKSLVRILSSMRNLSPSLGEWLEQLRGQPSETVHFDGLSAFDVRAQCALVLLAVRTRLPDPEMWALQAKYAPVDEEGKDDDKRYAFSAEKALAIRSLSTWVMQTSALSDVPSKVMDFMVAKFYAHQRKTKISFRALAVEFGGNHVAYFRKYRVVKELLGPLEGKAIARLHPYFVVQGIVIDQVAEAA